MKRNVPIRVALVNYLDGATIQDWWLAPPDHVADYLTPVSGLTAAIIASHGPNFSRISTIVHWLGTNLGPRSWMFTHAGANDFSVLGLRPPINTIDTSDLFEHPESPENGVSLAALATEFLNHPLNRENGHCPVMDARATAELVGRVVAEGTSPLSE